MKILIVSDTHRRDGNLRAIIEKQSPFDMLIHLGDTEGSEIYFKEWVNNDNCVIHVVRGNNDFFSQTDKEKEISIGKYRAFLTHGHMYGVSFELETIKEEARARKVDIVIILLSFFKCQFVSFAGKSLICTILQNDMPIIVHVDITDVDDERTVNALEVLVSLLGFKKQKQVRFL